MLTSRLVCPTKTFLMLVGDHRIDAVPEPRSRPGSGCSTGRGITKQVRVENPAIDVDPPSNRDAAACVCVGMEGPSDTPSKGGVADEVVRHPHVSHPLLHDPLKGVSVPRGKIRCVRRRVSWCRECALAWSRVLGGHEYPRVTNRGARIRDRESI